jgi:hypothetical protein
MRRFGYFVTESSEHTAEYTPYFLKDPSTATARTRASSPTSPTAVASRVPRDVEMLVQTVCERAGVSPTIQAPPGIDAVWRRTDDAAFLFLLNHNDKTVEVRLPKPGRDLLTCKEYDSTLMLDPPEVAVLREIARG